MRRRSSPVPAAGMARSVTGRRTPASALPQWIRPQLTELVVEAPEGDQWLHEIKYDGYRMHARLDRGAVKLLTRTGLDLPEILSRISPSGALLRARSGIKADQARYFRDGSLAGLQACL